MATVPLGQLGELRSGHLARVSGLGEPGPGRFRALQVGDLAPDGTIPWALLPTIEPTGSIERSRIHEGDLLMPLRSPTFRAVVAESVPRDVVAVGHWAILTPDPSKVLADYLAWYLAHTDTVARMQRALVQGSTIKFISLTALRGFPVEVPPLDVQRRIAEAARLQARAEELERQLADARRAQFERAAMAAVREAIRHPENRENGA